MTNIFEKNGNKYVAHFCYIYKDDYYPADYSFTEEEYNRFQKEKTFPLTSLFGLKIWVNKDGLLHRTDGPAVIFLDNSDYSDDYYYNGFLLKKEEWKKASVKRVYFLRKKIIILQKLTEIPELFQKVYYAHKKDFMALLNKI